jgi:aspartate-semialdehyde dehydrogenase
MVVALAPIYKKFGIKRVIASTYQAVSGSGRSAIVQTEEEFKAWANGKKFAGKQAMDQLVSFNLFPHIGGFREDGFTSEEMKMVYETHKILHDKKIKISTTTVRVPILNGHSEAVYIETGEPVSADKARSILRKAPGIIVMDDPKNKIYPMPRDISGKDETFVGRIRNDQFVKNGLWLWIVADNIRKGAATNAVQIAEAMVKMKLVK